MWTPERPGVRGSAPPRKVEAPRPAALTCPWPAGSSPPRCGWTASCAWPSPVRDAGSWFGGVGRQGRVQRAAGGRAVGGRQTGSPRGRAARGGEGKRGGGVIASTSFTPTPAPRAGGHSARECQSPAGAPGNGRGRPRPRRLLVAWRGRGGAHAEALTPCGRFGAWGSPLRPVETVGAQWPAPGVRVGGGRGRRARTRARGAVGPLVCSEAWGYVGPRSGRA